jgi:hypothetical protein
MLRDLQMTLKGESKVANEYAVRHCCYVGIES